jgi:integrase/recombinase XerD
MHSVKTLLRDDYKNKDGESAVILQVYVKGKRIVLPTGVLVTEDLWDDEKKRVRKKHDKASDYNLIIENARSLVNDVQVKYRLNNQELTAAILRMEFKNPSKFINFIEWMRSEIKARKGLVSKSTDKQHNATLNCLEAFQKNIPFSEIDTRFLECFEKHLKLKEKNQVNTIAKKMKCLSQYLNRAKDANIIRMNPFEKYKIKKGKDKIVYLEEQELLCLIDLYGRELCPRNMKRVLKYFLFSCVTGLRLSDVKRLTMEHIINDVIHIIPQKKLNTDHELVTIPLCGAAKRLITDSAGERIRGRIFACYSDPVTNRYLKDIAKLKGLKKHLTFNVSRHTFATLFLEKTNDLASLQKLMGHHSIVQTMVYAHVSETKKREQIKCFDQIF